LTEIRIHETLTASSKLKNRRAGGNRIAKFDPKIRRLLASGIELALLDFNRSHYVPWRRKVAGTQKEQGMRRLGWILIIALSTGGLAMAASSAEMGNETITYTYDARGRLTNVSHAGSVNNNLQANYTYDKADNRETVNVTGSPN
jgi:YD repeat-containing protein